jgi:hypothetical protein
MRIQLYLNDEAQTEVCALFDMQANPFKVGDVIKLKVSEFKQGKISNPYSTLIEHGIKVNNEKKNKFNMKSIKLIDETKYMDLEDNSIIIEYFCELINN